MAFKRAQRPPLTPEDVTRIEELRKWYPYVYGEVVPILLETQEPRTPTWELSIGWVGLSNGQASADGIIKERMLFGLAKDHRNGVPDMLTHMSYAIEEKFFWPPTVMERLYFGAGLLSDESEKQHFEFQWGSDRYPTIRTHRSQLKSAFERLKLI